MGVIGYLISLRKSVAGKDGDLVSDGPSDVVEFIEIGLGRIHFFDCAVEFGRHSVSYRLLLRHEFFLAACQRNDCRQADEQS